MKIDDLLEEYSTKAAVKSEERANRKHTVETQKRAAKQKPIATRDELSDQVAQLAAAWGLKRKR